MKLHHLKPAPGSRRKRKRVGRGEAAGQGKTAGRGTKGWGARHQPKQGFEGGQMPLARRTPKLKGFTNPNRVEFQVVNLERLAKVYDAKAQVDRPRWSSVARAWWRAGQGAGPGRHRPCADGEGARVLRGGQGEDRTGGRDRRGDRPARPGVSGTGDRRC
jgi:hypothetical protein